MNKNLLPYFLILAMSGSAYALPLTGQSLSGDVDFQRITPTVAAVGSDVEFRTIVSPNIPGISTVYSYSIDFSESGLVTIRSLLGSMNNNGSYKVTFSDIFAGIEEISGFSLVSSTHSAITQSDLSFTADTVSVQLGFSRLWNLDSVVVAQMSFGSNNNGGGVPVPAPLVLMALGTVGLGCARRLC